MNNPYVSVVIVGRNDTYGDDFLTRINTFVRSLDHQVKIYPGMFELVVVEWNPLSDRAPLSDVLAPTENLAVRIITVPPAAHDALGSSSPVLEFHGKNVGIRRARGEFVLVANPDILFTQQLIDRLGQRQLRSDSIYRTDRYDFRGGGIADVAADELVDFALANTFRAHGMSGNASVSVDIDGANALIRLPQSRCDPGIMHTNACGDFMLASREAWFTARGLYETLEHRWHVDSISLFRMQQIGLHQVVMVTPECIFHQDHPRREEDIEFANVDINQILSRPRSTAWGLVGQDLVETVKEPQ